MNAHASENYLAISRSSSGSASKSVEIFWVEIYCLIRDDFFLGPNLVSFNQAVVAYEISKVNVCVAGLPLGTTLKSEGEVTSLSGADKREVRDNREKW